MNYFATSRALASLLHFHDGISGKLKGERIIVIFIEDAQRGEEAFTFALCGVELSLEIKLLFITSRINLICEQRVSVTTGVGCGVIEIVCEGNVSRAYAKQTNEFFINVQQHVRRLLVTFIS